MHSIELYLLQLVRPSDVHPKVKQAVAATEHGMDLGDKVIDVVPLFFIFLKANNYLEHAFTVSVISEFTEMVDRSNSLQAYFN